MGLTPLMTMVEYNSMKFLIAGRPNIVNIRHYAEELLQRNAKTIVRVCGAEYDTYPYRARGITVEDLTHADGKFPPEEIIERWLEIVRNYFFENPDGTLAVHCQYGLGRSAVLVAVALMESGMDNKSVVETIRQKNNTNGSINETIASSILEEDS
ncbi:hypothetical protein FQA39_LY05987 [Lamprigera yunnana]|nr:hypothetical protein FQA39_LY05987 [Lamprigera yunnana]